MIEFLQQFDSKTAAAILAEAALSTSPIPEIEGEKRVAPYAEEVAQLLKSARSQLKLKDTDASAEAKVRLDKFLNSRAHGNVFKGH